MTFLFQITKEIVDNFTSTLSLQVLDEIGVDVASQVGICCS